MAFLARKPLTGFPEQSSLKWLYASITYTIPAGTPIDFRDERTYLLGHAEATLESWRPIPERETGGK